MPTIVDPRPPMTAIPAGSRAHVLNNPEREYLDLPSVVTPNGYVITRWTLSREEQAAIVRGEDIYVTLLSHGSVNPLFVSVGPVDWTVNATSSQPISLNPALDGVLHLAEISLRLYQAMRPRFPPELVAEIDDIVLRIQVSIKELRSR